MRAILLSPMLACATLVASAQTTTPPVTADHAVPGWYLGMPVLLHASPPPQGVDRATLARFPVYVVAPVSASAGSAAMKQVSHPRTGESVALPPHQDTLSALNSMGKPRLGIGYFVIRGPKGSAETVRTQPQPEKSWPSSPLVSHILIGPEWVGLNNHLVVEYGLATGVLALEYFDVGGMMWGELLDPDAGTLGTVEVKIERTPVFPPIDWTHGKDFPPGRAPDVH